MYYAELNGCYKLFVIALLSLDELPLEGSTIFSLFQDKL